MAKLELRLRTFIPQDKIFVSSTNGMATYFGGDNRSEAWEGSYRTSQRFVIDTSTYSVTAYKDTGVTHQYVYAGNNLLQTKEKKVDTEGITFTKRVVDDVLYLDCKCSAANPFVLVAPAIDYEFTLKITKPGSVRITGNHDGFPGYEFWRKFDGKGAQLVWSHDPRKTGDTIASLGGGMEKSADKGLSFDA